MNKATVVLTRYGEDNSIVKECLFSLANQKEIKLKIIFLDQKKDKDLERLCNLLTNKNIILEYKNIPAISLSYARNLGTSLSKTDIVLFTDADAIPDKKWAKNLTDIFKLNAKIGIVGGKSIPLWSKRTKWFHNSNLAKEVYSLLDLSEKIILTTKIVGVNFALHKKRLNLKEYFNPKLGRKPGSLQGGEETELCKIARSKGLQVYYTPHAVVKHQVQEERMKMKWLQKRFYFGGYTKSKMGGVPSTYSKKRNTYDLIFLAIILPSYIIGFLRGKIENVRSNK